MTPYWAVYLRIGPELIPKHLASLILLRPVSVSIITSDGALCIVTQLERRSAGPRHGSQRNPLLKLLPVDKLSQTLLLRVTSK